MTTSLQKENNVNDKQNLFCELYSSDREFFGNGTQAYIKAYNVDLSRQGAYKSAMASSSRLLSNGKILEHINSLLELRGLNDPFVDKQLELLVTQNADFKSKLGAIKEYNTLKKRTEVKILEPSEKGDTYIKEQKNIFVIVSKAEDEIRKELEQ